MAIWAAEIILKNLSRDVRAGLLNPSQAPVRLFGTKRRGFEELFVLTTDSQFVVYGVGASIDPMLNFFLRDPRVYDHVNFYKTTEASVNNLFATATGLCADLKGARSVEEQLRKSHREALNGGGIGLVLDCLVRQSLRVSQKVRAATGIDDLSRIVVDAGMEIVFGQVSNPCELSYLVIGSGDIATNTLETLYHEGFRNVTLASDNHAKATILAEKFAVSHIGMDQVETFLHLSDVIISEESIDVAITAALTGRKDIDPGKIFLDLGNCNTPGSIGTMPFRHYTIEDINHMPKSNANVFHSLESAWQMVEIEARIAVGELSQLQHVPMLSACWPRLVGGGAHETSLLMDHKMMRTKSALVEFLNGSLLRERCGEHFSQVSTDRSCADYQDHALMPGHGGLARYAKNHRN